MDVNQKAQLSGSSIAQDFFSVRDIAMLRWLDNGVKGSCRFLDPKFETFSRLVPKQ